VNCTPPLFFFQSFLAMAMGYDNYIAVLKSLYF